jgi:hypothetical protein
MWPLPQALSVTGQNKRAALDCKVRPAQFVCTARRSLLVEYKI